MTPPSTSLMPALAPARRPVTRSFTPLTAVPSCFGSADAVDSGSPRSQRPAVAVSVPLAFAVQPSAVSKLSKKTVVTGAPPATANTRSSRSV